jgi:hypothetical protein
MTGLTLIGLGDGGDHLVVETADGARLTLPITDELRRTVRRGVPVDAAQPSVAGEAHARHESGLTPREIQQRLRAGLTPAELAELSGEPLSAIEKFAVPVLAEREYVVDQARSTRIGRDSSSPVLDELVLDRLAARGVRPEDVVWDAWRAPEEPWRVATDFRVDGRSSRAVWTYDHNARSLTADDEEARWLTETELLDAPIPRRHLSAVRQESGAIPLHPSIPQVAQVDRVMSDGAPPSAAIPMPELAQLTPTEALLDELNGLRGTRESVAMDEDGADDDDEAFEGFGPAAHSRTAPVGFGGPPPAAPGETPVADPVRAGHPAGTGAAPPTPGTGERKPRKGRASVPSWDEIVFGAKNNSND